MRENNRSDDSVLVDSNTFSSWPYDLGKGIDKGGDLRIWMIIELSS